MMSIMLSCEMEEWLKDGSYNEGIAKMLDHTDADKHPDALKTKVQIWLVICTYWIENNH